MTAPASPTAASAHREWRWIPPLCLDGTWQMAIDEWCLDACVSGGGGPLLRLYTWKRPTLSLGFHQHRLEPHWLSLQDAGMLALVRRPSGGRAVLHGGCLTYALVWPEPPPDRARAYALATAWLHQALAGLGLPLQAGRSAAVAAGGNCFASSTPADLVDAQGCKRIGSAQLWRRGRLLQHGALLLEPDRELWQTVFRTDPPAFGPLPLSGEALVQHLREAAERHLSGPLIEQPLRPEEWSAIAGRLDRYPLTATAALQQGTVAQGRVCELPAMPRATSASGSPRG